MRDWLGINTVLTREAEVSSSDGRWIQEIPIQVTNENISLDFSGCRGVKRIIIPRS